MELIILFCAIGGLAILGGIFFLWYDKTHKPEPKVIQTKFFTASNITEMEATINSWLSQHPNLTITDKRMTTKDGPDSEIVVSIWYETTKKTTA